jgi:hypothetical protein
MAEGPDEPLVGSSQELRFPPAVATYARSGPEIRLRPTTRTLDVMAQEAHPPWRQG